MPSTRENPQCLFLTPRIKSPFRGTSYSTAEFIHFAQNLWLLYTEGKSHLAKWHKAVSLNRQWQKGTFRAMLQKPTLVSVAASTTAKDDKEELKVRVDPFTCSVYTIIIGYCYKQSRTTQEVTMSLQTNSMLWHLSLTWHQACDSTVFLKSQKDENKKLLVWLFLVTSNYFF